MLLQEAYPEHDFEAVEPLPSKTLGKWLRHYDTQSYRSRWQVTDRVYRECAEIAAAREAIHTEEWSTGDPELDMSIVISGFLEHKGGLAVRRKERIHDIAGALSAVGTGELVATVYHLGKIKGERIRMGILGSEVLRTVPSHKGFGVESELIIGTGGSHLYASRDRSFGDQVVEPIEIPGELPIHGSFRRRAGDVLPGDDDINLSSEQERGGILLRNLPAGRTPDILQVGVGNDAVASMLDTVVPGVDVEEHNSLLNQMSRQLIGVPLTELRAA